MTVRSQIAEPKATERNPTTCLHLYLYKIRKVDAFRHPTIVSCATPPARECSHALENADVSAMGASVFIVQEFARILFAQADALVERVIRERRDGHGIDGLVFIVERIGLRHVVVAVQMPIF